MPSAQRRKDRQKEEREAKRRRAQELLQQKNEARRAQRIQHEWLHKRMRTQQKASLPATGAYSRLRVNNSEEKGYITIPAWALLLIIGLAFVAGIYIYREYWGQPPVPEPLGPTTTSEFPALENTAPDFVLVYVGDPSQIFQLSDWQGYPVLVEFFSTRCSACTTYLPTLKTIATQYSDRIVMVSISVRWLDGTQPDTREALQQYIVEEDIAWWVVLDTAKAVSQNESATSSATEAYGIQATPTTVLIDQAGQIVFNQVGAISLATLNAQIQQLLG